MTYGPDPKRGELINARARAGARLVEAQEKLKRTPVSDVAAHREAAQALAFAEFDFDFFTYAEENYKP